jgi:hypothetical protein
MDGVSSPATLMIWRDLRAWMLAAIMLAMIAIGLNLWIVVKMHSAEPFAPNAVLPLPTGRTLEGTPIQRPAVGAHPCYVLRYASEQCPFCKADYPVFAALDAAASGRGCQTWVISPTPGEFPRPVERRRVNVAYIDLHSARMLRLSETPTTVLLDQNQVIRWVKVGALSSADIAQALSISSSFDNSRQPTH